MLQRASNLTPSRSWQPHSSLAFFGSPPKSIVCTKVLWIVPSQWDSLEYLVKKNEKYFYIVKIHPSSVCFSKVNGTLICILQLDMKELYNQSNFHKEWAVPHGLNIVGTPHRKFSTWSPTFYEQCRFPNVKIRLGTVRFIWPKTALRAHLHIAV